MLTKTMLETADRASARGMTTRAPRPAATARPVAIAASKLPAEVLESIWLEEVREGSNTRTIARRENVGVRTVQLGVTRARLRELAKVRVRDATVGGHGADDAIRRGFGSKAEGQGIPRMVPLFPIGSFTPTSTCSHRHPILPGSSFCCMVCHASGVDGHPALKRDAKTEPAPEPVEASGVPKARDASPSVVETRKARRRRLHAANVDAAQASMAG